MKTAKPALLSFLLALNFACGGLQPHKKHKPKNQEQTKLTDDGSGIAQFKGYEAINQIIRARMIEEDGDFSLGDFLGDHFSPFIQGLTDLLGVYSGTGTANEFRNGEPNAVNMLLWYTAFSRLSTLIAAQECGQEEVEYRIALNKEFKDAVDALCAWPDPSARNAENLTELWDYASRFDAPEVEKSAWQEFFLSKEYADKSAIPAVADLLTAVFYNPYFLLRN
jgi:hypothetical protein